MRLLRAASFQAYFVTLTAVLGVGGLAIRGFARHRALGFARWWAGLVLAGARRIVGIRYVLEGGEHLPDGPAILASQHQSAFDTLVWMVLLPRPAYVFKQELRRIPLFGPLLEPAGMIPVDRGAGAAALRQLLEAARQAMDDGRQLILFPEGTRTEPGVEVPLQPGIVAVAGRLGLPVLPVATDSGLRWGRGLAKRPGVIHIAVGPPIAPARRDRLLADITASWRTLQGGWPVDNPVRNPRRPGQDTFS